MNKNEQFRHDVLSSVEALTYEQLNQQPASIHGALCKY